MTRVPFFDVRKLNARFRDAFVGGLSSVLGGHSLILGDEVVHFEEAWARYCARAYCVGVGNGYDALRLMLRAYGIGPGLRVLVNANTHIATWLAVADTGATPVPVDVDPGTYQMHPPAAYAAMTENTAAVLTTHMYGGVPDMEALRAAADRYGKGTAALLVDAAHAHGIKGALLGDAAAFSFYPTKNLGALGDAGAVVTDNEYHTQRLRLLRNYGKWAGVYPTRGINSRLDELQAAFLTIKLPLLDEHNARRRTIAERYTQELGRYRAPAPEGRHVFHQYVITIPRSRQAFRDRMSERGVETLVHYATVPHLELAFAYLDQRIGDFPVAEALAAQVVSLPCNPTLTDDQVSAVIAAVKESA